MANVAVNALILREPFAGVSYSVYKLMCSLGECDRSRSYRFYIPRSIKREFPDGNNVKVKKSLIVSGKSPTGRVFYEQFIMPLTFGGLNADYAHFPAYVAPRMFYLPYVLTVHDVIPLLYPALCKNSTVKHFKGMLPRSAQKASRIIVPSEHVKTELQSAVKNLDADRIHVVPFAPIHEPSGVSKDRAKKILKEKYDIGNDFFLFVGNIEPKKNLPVLLKAFFAAKTRKGFSHKLVVVGQKAWMHKLYTQTIENHNMQDMVIEPGYVPEEDISYFYTACTAFCFPSITEGFGIPLLEALQEGCHCLVSDIPPFKELAGNCATYLPIVDVKEWRIAIEDAIEHNRSPLEKREVRKRQVAKYTWEETAKKTCQVYSLLENEFDFS